MLPLVFLAALTLISLLTVYELYKREINNICDKAYDTGVMLKDEIETGSFLNNSENSDIRYELEQTAEILDGRIIVVNSLLQVVYDSYNIETGKTAVSNEIVRGLAGFENRYRHKRDYYEIVLPVNNGETNTGVFVMRVSLKQSIKTVKGVAAVLGTAEAFAIVAIIAFACIYAKRVTNPIRKMSASIGEITETKPDAKIPEKGYRELKELAEAFNDMLARIMKLDESRKRFVSDVSHELKTPMTSMKLLADSLLSEGEGIPEEMYREFLTDISSEIDRENQIINDLLELVREEQKKEELRFTNTDINGMTEAVVKRMMPIAQQAGIKLVFDSYRSFRADVDEVKLSYALENLIENAIKYNRENGWVRVTTDCDHKFFFITVADSGIGIPAKDQEHIFDRFYRVDKARSRESGGTGLGLSIVRNIVFAHKGSIKLTSIIDDGSSFMLKIPLVYAGVSTGSGGEA